MTIVLLIISILLFIVASIQRQRINSLQRRMQDAEESIQGLKIAYDDTSKNAYELFEQTSGLNERCVTLLEQLANKND